MIKFFIVSCWFLLIQHNSIWKKYWTSLVTLSRWFFPVFALWALRCQKWFYLLSNFRPQKSPRKSGLIPRKTMGPYYDLMLSLIFFLHRWRRQITQSIVSPTRTKSFMRSSGDILSAFRARMPEQDGQDRLLRVGQHREARRLRSHQLSAFRKWQWLRNLRYRYLICFFRSCNSDVI